MQYRGKRENLSDYFPVIEAASDSLGNSVSNPSYSYMLVSPIHAHVGDSVEIIGYSTDPQGGILEYNISKAGTINWTEANRATIAFTIEDIGKCCDVRVQIRTKRDYHAYSEFDDFMTIRYVVLP